MNKRLPEEIFNIVKRLDKSEIKSFQTFAQRKKPADNKGHKYIQLFDLYLKQKKELEFSEAMIIEESKMLTDSLLDLNQKLHEELLKFLAYNYREKSTDSIERKVEDLLDTSIALYEKRLYALSARTFLNAILILKEVKDQNLTEKLLYLAIKAYSWVFTIRYRGKLTDEEQKEFDTFHEYARPFSQIARNAFSALQESNRERSLDNENFNKATFYTLLNIYFRERSEFDSMFKNRGNDMLFPIASLLKGSYKKYSSQDNIAEQAEDSIIDAESFFFQLERLYRAVAVNDNIEFDQAFNSIRSKLFPAFSLSGFNADLLLFVYKQLFELKTIFTLQNNQLPLDVYGLREFEQLSRSKMHLFHESEIGDFALRVELNSFIVLFLEQNYKELLKRITKFEKGIKGELDKDYYIDVKLMAIICRIEAGGAADEELDNRIDYYENYTKRYKTSVFHKKFDGFLRAFLKVGYNDRKKECSRYLTKLESSKETFNQFHSVFLYWLKAKAA